MVSRREVGAAALVAASLLPRRTQARDAPSPTTTAQPPRIAMLLYPGMTALDVVGPQGLLAGLAPGSLHLVARAAGPVPSDTGISLRATTSFADCPADLDVLFVPGGDGTPAQMRDAATLAFLQDRADRARWVTSVCTGSLILGAAGLLDGYRATSHWCVRDTLLPLLGAIPVDGRVVFDRNRVTAAGISAGLDFALALAARLRSEEYARTAQLVAEYAPQPPFAAGSPAIAGPATTREALAILGDLVAEARAAATTRRPR
ncbi:DJ-1/PfpI family protein [Methylobacterium radiodurans]|uniref:Thiamine biosynthesis protein ThiJ n=1 Tax=Methylobacterium radiodurans TaxID=2202828 RepID=A0A2U8VVD3_9HYPH|nr:DJ-1/PfpI family protein [Methylobacterium radiodurans]AWN37202.1 thiamine biosynthesis protein ThiJ [Methylobacterium radiodurans]